MVVMVKVVVVKVAVVKVVVVAPGWNVVVAPF